MRKTKKLATTFLAVIAASMMSMTTLAATPSPATTLSYGQAGMINGNNVCLRTSPGFGSGVLGLVNKNERFVEYGQSGVWKYCYMTTGGWTNRIGYVHQQYCTMLNYGVMSAVDAW